MRAMKTAWLVIVATLAVLGPAGPAAAQTQMFGLNVEGETEAGVRLFGERPSKSSSGKFEEYRDLPQGPFLERFQLRLFRPDESYSFEFEGSKWGQQDQEFSLRSGRLGLWEFGFDWDQMRHVFSTNARMLATETSRGVYTLPSGLARAAALTAADSQRYNTAPEIDEISTRWDTARLFFRLTPTPDLELKAEYKRINKDGDRPMGVPFGHTFIEVLEPIEQTIHDLRLHGTIAREQWQLQFGYTFSLFENDLRSLTADNPFRATDATNASSAGRMSLPPDNMAHTWNLAGGVNLPMRTRVNANFSYSRRFQYDEFLPHTRNPLMQVEVPQGSLNGNVQVFLFNVNATSRPLPPLTLSLKYRFYDYVDASDKIDFPTWVETDTTIRTNFRQAGRWSYRKQNTEMDGRWRIVQPVAFTLGAGWERWDRNEHREAPETDELSGKAVLDVTPFDWLLLKAKYVPSFRRMNRYNTRAHALHFVEEDEALSQAGQSFLLRKVDEADRDRHRLDLLVQFTPTDTFTATPTVGYRHDDYIESTLGLQRDITWSAGMDLDWMPLERVSLSGGYMHESIFHKQRSRYRTSTVDNKANEWISVNTDTVETFRAGTKATLIPKSLDWTVDGNYSISLGRIQTRNLESVTTASARASRLPAFEDSLFRLETALKYHFWKSWTASLGYAFESFEQNDWRSDTLIPVLSGLTSAVFLGADQKDYDAHIVGVTLKYRFK